MNKLLICQTRLPEFLDVSRTTIHRMLTQDLMPAEAGKIKSAKMWSIEDLKLWISLGMPNRRVFEARKKMLTKGNVNSIS